MNRLAWLIIHSQACEEFRTGDLFSKKSLPVYARNTLEHFSRYESNIYSVAADLTLCHPPTGPFVLFSEVRLNKEGGECPQVIEELDLHSSFFGADCSLGAFVVLSIFLG
jgi:hypothetical protein